MHPTILVTGGCRSGKSSHALTLAAGMKGSRKFFVATCVPHDDEMKHRVERHKTERGQNWQTIEEPIALAETIRLHGKGADIVLIDCLTLWISNLLLKYDRDPPIRAHIDTLCETVSDPPCPLIFVTNEVGSGIVPQNRLARRFRDLTGWANQHVAAACRQVVWMVSGIAVTIKPQNKPLHSGKPGR